MNWHTRGSGRAVAGFLAATLLVLTGLAWVTHAALRLEQEQAIAQAETEHHRRMDLAMWRLENLVAPARAAEAARPVEHYQAFFAPRVALNAAGDSLDARTILEPSPLLTAELPDWFLIHFHLAANGIWSSPQVVPPKWDKWAQRAGIRVQSQRHAVLLAQLNQEVPSGSLLARLGGGKEIPQDLRCYFTPVTAETRQPVLYGSTSATFQSAAAKQVARSEPDATLADQSASGRTQSTVTAWVADSQREQAARQNAQFAACNALPTDSPADIDRQLELFFCPSNQHDDARPANCEGCRVVAPSRLPPMVPVWLPTSGDSAQLAFVRPLPTHHGLEVQGVLLDWTRLRGLLSKEVSDLFPEAVIEPDMAPSDREPFKMCNLPVRLRTGRANEAAPGGWTSLRAGLAAVWVAAMIALGAVGWGGWTLLELSERRQQFVSAVTHELRTPLTTLRLYLDMLSNGMVHEESRRAEYLRTLSAESDRLAGVVGNVLEYARLDNRRPNLNLTAVSLKSFLNDAREMLEPRCTAAGKSLVVVPIEPDSTLTTDANLLRQILSNLIDNACKHTPGASDNRVWLRVARGRSGGFTMDVEDRGPGIAPAHQKRIFRSFWRGPGSDGCPAPGVGLGLALAKRWARLLGGSLQLESPIGSLRCGCRFSLWLPHTSLALRDVTAPSSSRDGSQGLQLARADLATSPAPSSSLDGSLG